MSSLVKLLYPGMHLKRWVILLMVGVTFVSLGIAYLMVQVYRTQPFPDYVGTLTLQFLGRTARGFIFIVFGTAITGIALYQLSRSILVPFMNGSNPIDKIYQHRSRRRGPKVVAIGGGTGLSTLLRGMKEYTDNLTAIVSVADDGGSSGILRQQLGILPPGDVRQCLVALADAEPLMTRLFQYRFETGVGLEGHSFGNLFIAAMKATTGNFEDAIKESSRVLAVRGQILPATLENVNLLAEFDDGSTTSGETAIRHAAKRIKHLFLQPERPGAFPEAIRAIEDADVIVMGPGSLYTSVMPNLLVEEIAEAIRVSAATKVYVCNVATEYGETDEFRVADHIAALERQVGPGLFSFVLVNDNLGVQLPENFHSRLVEPKNGSASRLPYHVVLADVIDAKDPRRHSSRKLAKSILRIHYAPPTHSPSHVETEQEVIGTGAGA